MKPTNFRSDLETGGATPSPDKKPYADKSGGGSGGGGNTPAAPKGSMWKNVLIGILLAIIAFESVIIYEQKRANRQIEAQANADLNKFLKTGATPSTSGGSDIMFRNVRFCWSQKTCIDADRLTATATPLNGGSDVNFDNLKSFIVNVHNANVLISPKTLEGMFNESVFNYPGSKLRNLTVSINTREGTNRVKLGGSLNFIFWIPFEMDTDLKVNKTNNTLMITVYKLKVLGFVPATWLIKIKPFNLDKLLTLPPNNYLTVRRNVMMVKPFGLFPPPRINGKMDAITVNPRLIQLKFSGKDPAFSNIPEAGAKNYIYVQHGNAQFGKIKMYDAQAQVIDADGGGNYRFSLLNYLDYLPKSQVKLLNGGGAVARMPDNTTIPSLSGTVAHPQNDEKAQKELEEKARAEDKRNKPGFWSRTKAKFKSWFGI